MFSILKGDLLLSVSVLFSVYENMIFIASCSFIVIDKVFGKKNKIIVSNYAQLDFNILSFVVFVLKDFWKFLLLACIRHLLKYSRL